MGEFASKGEAGSGLGLGMLLSSPLYGEESRKPARVGRGATRLFQSAIFLLHIRRSRFRLHPTEFAAPFRFYGYGR